MKVKINIPAITINITMLSPEAQAGLAAIPALVAATSLINERTLTMATNQAAAEAKLDALGTKLDKISGETTGLVQAVRDLQAAAEAAGNLPQSFMDKLDALGSKADSIDAQVDDVAPNPTPTPPPADDGSGNGGTGTVGADGNPIP